MDCEVRIANGHLWQMDPHHSILGGYVLGVPALLLLSLFPCLSVLTNIVAMDRVLIHFPLLRSSPSQKPVSRYSPGTSPFEILYIKFNCLPDRFSVESMRGILYSARYW